MNMELLTTKEAARYLCISADSLANERGAGRLIGIKIGGLWRYDRRDLDAYVNGKRDAAALAAHARLQRASGKKVVRMRPDPRKGQPDAVWTPGKRIQDACASRTGPASKAPPR